MGKKGKSIPRGKIILAILGLVIILISIGIFYSNTNTSCNSLLCKLTGNVIASSSSPIVAQFGNEIITSDELDKSYDLFFFLKKIPASYKNMLPKEKFLNETISEDLLYVEAIKQGYGITANEAETKLTNSLATSGINLDDFKKELKSNNINYNSIMTFYQKQLVITAFLNKTLLNNIKISNNEILDYYNNNINLFKTEGKIRASHILVNTSNEAKEIIKKLDNGANFTELAKENSIGPSASKGGDLGFFIKGQMVPAFENAAFTLKNIGDYTKEPVKTQFGYHIIILTNKTPAKTLSLEESKTDIINKLLSIKQGKLIEDYTKTLLKKTPVKIYEENINNKN